MLCVYMFTLYTVICPFIHTVKKCLIFYTKSQLHTHYLLNLFIIVFYVIMPVNCLFMAVFYNFALLLVNDFNYLAMYIKIHSYSTNITLQYTYTHSHYSTYPHTKKMCNQFCDLCCVLWVSDRLLIIILCVLYFLIVHLSSTYSYNVFHNKLKFLVVILAKLFEGNLIGFGLILNAHLFYTNLFNG